MNILKRLLNSIINHWNVTWILNILYLIYALLLNGRVYRWINGVENEGQTNLKLSLVLLLALLIELPAIWFVLRDMRHHRVKKKENAGIFIVTLLLWTFHFTVSAVVLFTFTRSLGFPSESGPEYFALILLIIREFVLFFMIIMYDSIPDGSINPKIKLLAELALIYVTCIVYTDIIYPSIAGMPSPHTYGATPQTFNLPDITPLFILLQLIGSFIVFSMFYLGYRFVHFISVIFTAKNTRDWVELIFSIINAYIFLIMIPLFVKLLLAIRIRS